MAPPLRPEVRPTCPKGHVGRVLLDGVRLLKPVVRVDGLTEYPDFSRPRYRCVPTDDPRAAHRFTGTREHRTTHHPAGVACPTCDTRPKRDQGPLVPHNWDFPAHEVAEALALVGRGLSYRKAAAQIRLNARRFRADTDGLAVPSKEAQTVARYLDIFGPAIVESVAHKRWPKVLLLDAKPIRHRKLDPDGNPVQGGEVAGAILGACGYTDKVPQTLRAQRPRDGEEPRARYEGPKRFPHLWHVALAGGLDAASWWEFLGQLDGEPEWVVTDGDEAVKAAVSDRWGGRPEIYSCEGHLQRNFEEAAKKDGWSAYDAEALFGDAFDDLDTWQDFMGRLFAQPASRVAEISAWVERRFDLVMDQIEMRHDDLPRGIGPMESSFEQLDDWIGERRKVFRNVRRTNLALALMRAQIAGHANTAAYARIVRDMLEAANGRPSFDWTEHQDHDGLVSLYELVDAAEARHEAYRPIATVSAKNRSVEAKVFLADAYRCSLGLPPLVVNRTGETISVSTRNQTLSDRPEIAREWDPMNDGDPTSERASSGRVVDWICALDDRHRWPAMIRDRCMRLTGCPIHAREVQSAGKGRKKAKPASPPVPLLIGLDQSEIEVF